MVPERNGRTDRQTDIFAISILRVSMESDMHGRYYVFQMTADTEYLSSSWKASSHATAQTDAGMILFCLLYFSLF